MNEITSTISSNQFSVDQQVEDAVDWLRIINPARHAKLLAEFPEWESRVWAGAWFDTEAMGVDPNFTDWVIDEIEDSGEIWWEEGEPYTNVTLTSAA